MKAKGPYEVVCLDSDGYVIGGSEEYGSLRSATADAVVEVARQRDEALAVLRTLADATAEYMRTPPEPSATWAVIERRFRDARRAAWAVLNDDDIR